MLCVFQICVRYVSAPEGEEVVHGIHCCGLPWDLCIKRYCQWGIETELSPQLRFNKQAFFVHWLVHKIFHEIPLPLGKQYVNNIGDIVWYLISVYLKIIPLGCTNPNIVYFFYQKLLTIFTLNCILVLEFVVSHH